MGWVLLLRGLEMGKYKYFALLQPISRLACLSCAEKSIKTLVVQPLPKNPLSHLSTPGSPAVRGNGAARGRWT